MNEGKEGDFEERSKNEVYYTIEEGSGECMSDSCSQCNFLYDDTCPFLIG